MDASTVKAGPRYRSIVRALAGDSTITRFALPPAARFPRAAALVAFFAGFVFFFAALIDR
jgi:hypothetical protein